MGAVDKEKKLAKEDKAKAKLDKIEKKKRKEAKEGKVKAPQEDEEAGSSKRRSPRLTAGADAAAVPSLALDAPANAAKATPEKSEKKDKKKDKGKDKGKGEPAEGKGRAKLDKIEKKKRKEAKVKPPPEEEGGSSIKAAGEDLFAMALPDGGSNRRSPRLAAAEEPSAAVPELSLSEMSPAEFRKVNEISGSGGELLPPVQSFAAAPFEPPVLQMFGTLGWTKPSAIQSQAWPIVIAGKDLIAIAKTGSGKTLGFLLPAFKLMRASLPIRQGQGPLALVMAPTRELAQQIHVEAERFGKVLGIACACVYGGAPKGPQIGTLSRGRPALLVGTPGRINDLLALKNPPVTNLSSCAYLVLDEADRMLDMGFAPQIASVLELLPSKRQTVFFTATWPKEVQALAASYLTAGAVKVFVGGADSKLVANKDVTQQFETLTETEKPERLKALLDQLPPTHRTIVFCNTKAKCEELAQTARRSGIGSVAIHGDRDQWQREEALKKFTLGVSRCMFATDVAARGLDVQGVTQVVNYDMPTGDDGVESYVHRIGRTGRAGQTGHAMTYFVERTDSKTAPQLVKLLREAQQEVPEFLDRAAASRGGKGKGKGKGRRW